MGIAITYASCKHYTTNCVQYSLSPGFKSDILHRNYLTHRQQPSASTHILLQSAECIITALDLLIIAHCAAFYKECGEIYL